MLGKMMSVMKKDFHSGRRDNMITYIVLVPLALAIIMKLFLPVMENMELSFAVSQDLEPRLVSQLEEYGQVEVFPDRAAVVKRVQGMDDVPGIVPGPEGYEVILEGNESEAVRELPGAILDYYAHGQPLTQIQVESLGQERAVTFFYAVAILLFTVVIIGGLAVGLTVVEEKETKTILAYQASPLSLQDYLAAKGALATVFIFALAYLVALIMLGDQMDYGALFWVLIACLPTGLFLGLVIGTFAHDQMSAIALMKALFIFFLGIPMASLFIGQQYHVFFYPLLNYWAIQALLAAVTEGAGPTTLANSLWALVTGVVPLALMMALMRKRLGLS